MKEQITLAARIVPAALAALDPEPLDEGPRITITWQPDDLATLPGTVHGLAELKGQAIELDLQGTLIAARIVRASYSVPATEGHGVTRPDGLILTVELVGRFRQPEPTPGGATSPSDPAGCVSYPQPLARPARRSGGLR